jgi:hypothetical protein
VKSRRVLNSTHLLIDSLEAGDLISVRGTLRIVRHVGRDDDGKVRNIILAIKRSSWTNQCYTAVVRCDLYHVQLEVVSKQFSSLDTWLDKRFTYSIEHPHAPDRLTAKDVIGVLM